MKAAPPPAVHDIRPEDNRLGLRDAWVWALFFCGLIALPGVWRELSSDPVRGVFAHLAEVSDGTAVSRIRAAEKQVNEGQWTKPIRRTLQSLLLEVFGEANRKVLVGNDGWLFHRPGLRALTGRGPMVPHAYSVSKDHELKQWEGCLPVIQNFASQLEERGIKLLLVPVPDKVSRATLETLGATRFKPHNAPVNSASEGQARLEGPSEAVPNGETMRSYHPDWERFTAALNASGVEVYQPDVGRYLKTDTHWHPSSISQVVDGVAMRALHLLNRADEIKPPRDVEEARDSERTRAKVATGDLVTALDLGPQAHPFPPETVSVSTVAPLAVSDPASEIVLLGDSNVNMYDDPSLPFHEPGAGFASRLRDSLGQPLHIIAINGGGATNVRQEFARLPDEVVRTKKLVIWVLAERDLLMDAEVAKENNVEWKRVVFNSTRSAPPSATEASGALVAEVTLTEKSALQDVAQANYPDAVYVALASVDRVLEGDYPEKEIQLVLWNFRNKEVQPSARYTVGQKLRVTLVPWLEQGTLTSTNLSDDFNRFDIPLYYVPQAEPR